MIPVLFAPKTREYNNNGLGVLVDVGYCTVTEERNGAFELELQYPVSGSHYSDLAVDCQVLAKPNETSDPQAFRIYNISKPMNGVVTVSAEHISYELSSVVVSPFSAENAPEAVEKIKTFSLTENNFDFWTDKDTVAKMSQGVPMSARSLLGGVSGSVLDVYGGEYEFDNYTVKLHKNRGSDNGITISYAKNLTGVKCDERSDGIVTGAIAYWSQENEGIAQVVYGDLQSVDTALSYGRNVVVDCSSEFSETPSKEQLNDFARIYIEKHKNVPYFSVSVEFVNLGDTEEYKEYKGLYRVSLCDTVTVKHPLYGINVKAKVVKTVFDSITEKYEKIEIGEATANISQTIVSQEKELSQKVGFSELDRAVAGATSSIAGNKGGYVVLYPNAVTPQELLLLDKPTIAEATNVWRWNLSGLGHSNSGYNGDFSTAITADGQIVADFITTGTLDASLIKVTNLNAESITAGSLSSKDGLSYFSLDNGNARFGGKEVYTEIVYGKLQQAIGENNIIGGITIDYDDIKGGYNQVIYYDGENKNSNGVAICERNSVGGFEKVAFFSKENVSVSGSIVTNSEKENSYFSLTHYRTADFKYNGMPYMAKLSYGCGMFNETSSISFEKINESKGEVELRLDICEGLDKGSVVISAANGNGYVRSKQLEIGQKLWWNAPIVIGGGGSYINNKIACFFGDVYGTGDVSGATITNRSDRKIKKNIKPTKSQNALSSINKLRIYDYDLKGNGKSVKMGLMADEAPAEILSDDGEGINLYSYCGLLAMAVKELSEKVEKIDKGVI